MTSFFAPSPGGEPALGSSAKQGESSGYVPFVTVTSPPSWQPYSPVAGGAVAEAPQAPRTASLPCQNSNNSTKPDRLILSPGQFRAAYALRENVKSLCNDWGLERLGFLTLTFADHVTDIKEAQRRFNSLRTHVLAKRYHHGIAVVERQKSGRIHFHLLVICVKDIRTGFDWDSVRRGDYGSANQCLRSEWAFWRNTARKYGFGRTELMPIRSSAEGIAQYVGKYIGKHLLQRKPEDKGVRLVRYFGEARKAGTRFAWVGIRSWLWRKKLAKFAAGRRIDDYAGLRYRLGSSWVWKHGDEIHATKLARYPSKYHALADNVLVGNTGETRPNGEVVLRDFDGDSMHSQQTFWA